MEKDKISRVLSEKIIALSFCSMFSVLLIHSRSIGTYGDVPNWCLWIETFLTRSLTCWAVPFFFLVSGFLFSNGSYMRGEATYLNLISNKTRTLFVPYLIWCIIGAIISIPIVFMCNYYAGRNIYYRTILDCRSVLEFLNSLFGVTLHSPLGNGVLWFLRALIIFFILAPLWKILSRRKWLLLVAACGLVYVGGQDLLPFTRIRYNSLGWFLMGICASIFDWQKVRIPKIVNQLSFVIMTILAILMCNMQVEFGSAACDELPEHAPYIAWIATAVIIFMWSSYDVLGGFVIKQWMRDNFWVYAMHGSVMAYFLVSYTFLFGKHPIVAIMATVITPWGAFIFCLTVKRLLVRKMPNIVQVLSGGR